MMTMRMATVLKTSSAKFLWTLQLIFFSLVINTSFLSEREKTFMEPTLRKIIHEQKITFLILLWRTLFFAFSFFNPFFTSIHYLRYAFFFFHSFSAFCAKPQTIFVFFSLENHKKISSHLCFGLCYKTGEIKKNLKLKLRKLLSRNLVSL